MNTLDPLCTKINTKGGKCLKSGRIDKKQSVAARRFLDRFWDICLFFPISASFCISSISRNWFMGLLYNQVNGPPKFWTGFGIPVQNLLRHYHFLISPRGIVGSCVYYMARQAVRRLASHSLPPRLYFIIIATLLPSPVNM